MARKRLALGQVGEVETTPQVLVDGKWTATDKARRAQRWRARAYFCGWDGKRRDVSTVAATKQAAIQACETRIAERLRHGDVSDQIVTTGTLLVTAGRLWLDEITRPGSGLSARSVQDYSAAFDRYIDAGGSALRGLTIAQAADPQRLRIYLQDLADRKGTGTAKIVRTILSNIFNHAVSNGVVDANPIRQIRAVQSRTAKTDPRDRSRAFTRAERDAVIAYADDKAARLNLDPRSVRKWETTAHFVAFLAGTGARIEEARSLRFEDVDLSTGVVRLRGTKSASSDRSLNVPEWLRVRLQSRADASGAEGLVFSSPSHLDEPDRPWDQSNSASAVRQVLDGAGLPWAVPHTFRRTVATLLHEAGVPLVKISDQLGHSDPAMTVRVYLGRDFTGDKADLALHL